jgi:hypothetical protein
MEEPGMHVWDSNTLVPAPIRLVGNYRRKVRKCDKKYQVKPGHEARHIQGTEQSVKLVLVTGTLKAYLYNKAKVGTSAE